jgi:hypothetical protein
MGKLAYFWANITPSLSLEACVGSVDWAFYSAEWGPTEVKIQASLDGRTFVDVEHISVNLDELQPQASPGRRCHSALPLTAIPSGFTC